uniref:site-specific tyrosine recombinase/integron integrase n=1 Tax=Candidatus Ventrenecus sp. TaxID=3085654 RepID=UPI003FEE8B86
MKTEVISNITKDMEDSLTDYQLNKLKESLIINFEGVEFIIKTDELKHQEELDENKRMIDSFISSKQVEGCSERTIKYYKEIIEKFVNSFDKSIKQISTNEIRNYLSNYKENSSCESTTIDNIRRVLSSFFSWLEDEDYIIKSPVRRIHKIKTAVVVKEVLTDENLERLRDECENIRDLSLIELLISTGMRVGELVNLNINSLNFEDRSCIVLGKGNKEREVYFDAKTKLHLKEYISKRNDSNDALFVSMREPHQRLSISGIELIIRTLGINSNINKVHPHKFRRTLATMAIDKGMPVEQVQKLLGHVKIETTMNYALVNQSNVKISHRRYIA